MNYGYIRVSTDKQTVENQRFEIEEFSKKRNITIDSWTSEVVSGTKKADERLLGDLLKGLKKGDRLIVSELSRLGRNLLQIMSILNYLMEKDIVLLTVKEGYELGNNINSKVLAFAFGLSAEIERNLISQRTKEALARKKAEGVILGRPKGQAKLSTYKLYKYKNEIIRLRDEGMSFNKIAKKYQVNRATVSKFIKRIGEENNGE
ncbi:master DNA invertase Mpi family serine-type recombinase [Lactobacillus equicursoris]|uniref:Master DNA invertase Mpi family serine-type recombinase n=1 Tax=Lactobacillus equicursoris TaxID=420645 RepID=A0A844FL21_9LACO|nr:master DNA invertase Mpi family serine-type recombinase [Lactobacillus equicursoris]MDD6408122.1 master DNA invertase Mpi family serine-type recombinase [Lactobacillus equicursoris]MST79254.1 master DNA invertase Mpi family serine-type recombinase [Lactobacillus equicursoris]